MKLQHADLLCQITQTLTGLTDSETWEKLVWLTEEMKF